jgi:hypothetical protein
MPAKKTELSDTERAKRIRETARETGTDNDPASFDRAFEAVASAKPKSKFPAHEPPTMPVGKYVDDCSPLPPLPPMKKPIPSRGQNTSSKREGRSAETVGARLFEPSNERVAMSWRRGLFRLWLVASVVWIACILAVAYKAGAFEWFTRPPLPAGFSFIDPLEDLRLLPVWALTPPLAVGVALLLIGWIVDGFHSPRSN